MSRSGDDNVLAPNRSVSLLFTLSFGHPHIEHRKLFGQFSNVHACEKLKTKLIDRSLDVCDAPSLIYQATPFVRCRLIFVLMLLGHRTDARPNRTQIRSGARQTVRAQWTCPIDGARIHIWIGGISYAQRTDLLLYGIGAM